MAIVRQLFHRAVSFVSSTLRTSSARNLNFDIFKLGLNVVGLKIPSVAYSL